MNHVVSQRFIQCLIELKRRNVVRSARQFALQVNFLPQSLNEIVKGRRDVTIDLIQKSVHAFQINPNYLFAGEGPMFSFEMKDKGLKVHTVVTDNEGESNIIHIPIPKLQRYASNALSTKTISDYETVKLPGLDMEKYEYRSFEVKGDAMHPTIKATEILVCMFIDPIDWASALRDEQPYVIVTNSDVLVKRVINRLETDGLLQLHSDNDQYKPFLVHEEEIREVWKPKFALNRFIDQNGTVNEAKQPVENELQAMLEDHQRILVDVQQQIRDLMKQRNTHDNSNYRR